MAQADVLSAEKEIKEEDKAIQVRSAFDGPASVVLADCVKPRVSLGVGFESTESIRTTAREKRRRAREAGTTTRTQRQSQSVRVPFVVVVVVGGVTVFNFQTNSALWMANEPPKSKLVRVRVVATFVCV